jgi:hypothetical protein
MMTASSFACKNAMCHPASAKRAEASFSCAYAMRAGFDCANTAALLDAICVASILIALITVAVILAAVSVVSILGAEALLVRGLLILAVLILGKENRCKSRRPAA